VPHALAVLFDVDGTLLDTKDEWIEAFNATLAVVGERPRPPGEILPWIGTPLETILSEFVGLRGTDIATATATFARLEHGALSRTVRVFRGIPEALLGLSPAPMGAVTNKRTDTAREALRRGGILPAFSVVVGGDAVERKKPAPDPVMQAARLLGSRPQDCVLVGDTENDILAGKAAGTKTIGVLWGYRRREKLEAEGPDALAGDPAELAGLVARLRPSTAI